MPDSTGIETEKHMKQLKRRMECWREVILPLNSILLWERSWYPGLILGITTTIFFLVWMLEPALLTMVSVILLVLALIDYIVPPMTSFLYPVNSWTVNVTNTKRSSEYLLCSNNNFSRNLYMDWKYNQQFASVLHCSGRIMDVIIKLNEQTMGRDKIIRLLQYGSRAYWYYAQNIRSTQHSAEILRSLEYTFSSFRKLLRLGRCLDSLYSALKIMKYPDVAVRITLTLSKIANALFLLADHIIWIGRVGLLRVNIEKWSKVANKYWLMSISMNLVRDILEIIAILEREGKGVLTRKPNFSSDIWKQYKLLFHLRNHKDIVIDAIKNGCDLFIPLTALGYTKLSPGTIGIFGVISSMVGLYTLIYPLYKLTPA